MRANKRTWVLAGLLVASCVALFSSASCAQAVSLKTNDGRVVQGDLSGLASVLRLVDPAPAVGPAALFDIPVSTIQQVWVDFPRVVIETIDRVFVAPYSAFSGIAQMLKVEQGNSLAQIPFTAIRQIALDGSGFRALPREWLGQQWLNQRVYVATKSNILPTLRNAPLQTSVAATATTFAAPAIATTTTTPTVTLTTADEDEVVWNGAVPEPAPATSSGELPWWVLLVGLAALFAVFILLPSGSGS